MPSGDTLTPQEAAYIATNSYFTLKDWIHNEPVAGVEVRENIENRVLGAADVGHVSQASTSLAGTGLGGSALGNVHSAKTGFGTSSGFGYTLCYEGKGRKHVVIATRGTRAEMPGKPDLITDLRAAMTSFGDFGPVHKGFKLTYESIMPNLQRDAGVIAGADVVHCVGHSLGGAVATLVAAHYASAGRNVKLYTFGSPRVGCFETYRTLASRIGEENIFRVTHDLDPISLIAPFPYIHVLPKPGQSNNMTLPSPSGKLLSTQNHDMMEYINSVGGLEWNGVRKFATRLDYDDSLIARWLLHDENNVGWVQYASAKTLSLLFKLFNHVLKGISTTLVLSLTAVDLLAEVLLKGLNRIAALGRRILQLLRHAANWAGLKVQEAADFGAQIIKAILDKMLASLKVLAATAYGVASRNLTPMTIGVAGSLLLTGCSVL